MKPTRIEPASLFRKDRLLGAAGNDTYVFRHGSGRDLVGESTGTDTVFSGSGLRRANFTLGQIPC